MRERRASINDAKIDAAERRMVQRSVAAADQVLLVEGEKDVENLEKLGFTATCNPGGACTHAGKWLKNYTEALDGKRVVILPDNDPPGQQHASVVVQAIRHRVAELRMLTIPEGKDASDWIAAGATCGVIQQAIDATPVIAAQKAAGEPIKERRTQRWLTKLATKRFPFRPVPTSPRSSFSSARSTPAGRSR